MKSFQIKKLTAEICSSVISAHGQFFYNKVSLANHYFCNILTVFPIRYAKKYGFSFKNMTFSWCYRALYSGRPCLKEWVIYQSEGRWFTSLLFQSASPARILTLRQNTEFQVTPQCIHQGVNVRQGP